MMSGNSTESKLTTLGDSGIETTVLGVVYLLLSIYIIVVNLVEIVIITRIKATSSTIFIARLVASIVYIEVFTA